MWIQEAESKQSQSFLPLSQLLEQVAPPIYHFAGKKWIQCVGRWNSCANIIISSASQQGISCANITVVLLLLCQSTESINNRPFKYSFVSKNLYSPSNFPSFILKTTFLIFSQHFTKNYFR